jgi:hypothetical protein
MRIYYLILFLGPRIIKKRPYHDHYSHVLLINCETVRNASVRVGAVLNPLNAELNPIYHFLALLGAHPILHVSGVRVNYVSIYVRVTCSGLARVAVGCCERRTR